VFVVILIDVCLLPVVRQCLELEHLEIVTDSRNVYRGCSSGKKGSNSEQDSCHWENGKSLLCPQVTNEPSSSLGKRARDP